VVEGLRSSNDPRYLEFASPDDPALFATGRRLVADGFGWNTGVWVTDDRGRVSMIRHPDSRQWYIPAGGHEPDLENTVEADWMASSPSAVIDLLSRKVEEYDWPGDR